MGGLEEDRRVEAVRLLKLAGDRLDEAYAEMMKTNARHEGEARPVRAATLACAACVTILRVPNSEMHWTVAASLRVSAKTIEGISDARVRAAWQDMMDAESICQDGMRAQ
jgi:hypothetical protein